MCNSYSTRSRSWLGIITQIPHNKQPSSTVISRRLLKYSVISGVICLSGQPVITYCSTLDKTGSIHVVLRTRSTFIGKDSICNKLMSLTSSTSSFALSLCIGKRINNRRSNDTRYHTGVRRAVIPIFVIVRLPELEYRSSVLQCG